MVKGSVMLFTPFHVNQEVFVGYEFIHSLRLLFFLRSLCAAAFLNITAHRAATKADPQTKMQNM